MPRVSQAHLDARREQILGAAERCFARDGFHATSMQDIFTEAGLSAGAVYRYFSAKTDIVRAIVDRVLDSVRQDLSAAAEDDDPRPLGDVLADTVSARLTQDSMERIRPILLQVWAEMGRDPEVHALGLGVLHEVHRDLTVLVRRAQRRGEIPAESDPAAAGQMLMAVIQGHIVHMAMLGREYVANVPEAVRVAAAGLAQRPIAAVPGTWRALPPLESSTG
jgi:TetR/AcrR family transcriptional regulator, transcriptional repressor of aconitase